MLVVGLFAVLCWDSLLPDQRDVLTLAPLPVRARTLFLAKVGGVGDGARADGRNAARGDRDHLAGGVRGESRTRSRSPHSPSTPRSGRFGARRDGGGADARPAAAAGDRLGMAVGVEQDGRAARGAMARRGRTPCSRSRRSARRLRRCCLAQMVAEGRVGLDDRAGAAGHHAAGPRDAPVRPAGDARQFAARRPGNHAAGVR